MTHIILTYDFKNTDGRADFIGIFEDILTDMGLNKENTNQSTYYGIVRSKEDFLRDLFNATNKMAWEDGGIVTIYYPKATNNHVDIVKHAFKSEGSKILNHMIFKAS